MTFDATVNPVRYEGGEPVFIDTEYDTWNVLETPVALHVSKRVLTLPLYADLSMDDVDRICDIILKCKC